MNFGWLDLPRDAAIFDMGQGTGILGKLLAELGYTNIEGADASQSFVTRANESGWYKSCSVLLFGTGLENIPTDKLGKYDLIMSAGCFTGGHIPSSGFDDAHAMLKTGATLLQAFARSITSLASKMATERD